MMHYSEDKPDWQAVFILAIGCLTIVYMYWQFMR